MEKHWVHPSVTSSFHSVLCFRDIYFDNNLYFFCFCCCLVFGVWTCAVSFICSYSCVHIFFAVRNSVALSIPGIYFKMRICKNFSWLYACSLNCWIIVCVHTIFWNMLHFAVDLEFQGTATCNLRRLWTSRSQSSFCSCGGTTIWACSSKNDRGSSAQAKAVQTFPP